MFDLTGKIKRIPVTIGFLNCIKYLVCKKLMFDLRDKGILDESGSLCVLRHGKKYMPSDKNFSRLACLMGFFYSGSGAAADLLAEYDNTSVLAFSDDVTPNSRNNLYNFEFDMLRHLGGVFSLELIFKTKNIFIRDSLLRLFLRLVAHLYYDERRPFGDEFLSQTQIFLEKIIAVRCDTELEWNHCPHLRCLGDEGASLLWGKGKKKVKACYYLKDLTCEEYRQIAHQYIISILKTFESNELLILDQACSDYSGDIGAYVDYLGKDVKILAVYRDPRDVYVTSRQKNEDSIPQEINDFIQWYGQRLGCYINVNHPCFKLIRFEDLVLKYDSVVSDIEAFLSLRPDAHKHAKEYFNPEVSRKNIGLHQTFTDQQAMNAIRNALPQYCYD